MSNNTTTELLAPAGTWEALVAAVQNGADAVYIGGTSFSARAGAQNFDNAMLAQAVRYCHVRGVKVFVALNTLIKEAEFEKAVQFAAFAYDIGADAIIIQDMGLASFILKFLPDIRLHASTQMTVHSVSGAKVLESLGFKRVVLARELTFEQIRQIKDETNMELEIFVHGAICCSYSGQCLFSSFLGGRSGNRGRCAQPCRLPYELAGESGSIKKGYLLSPKDMCLVQHMEKIKSAGIDSLKIEGRLKRPEYVAAVTKVYRKYLDTPKKPEKCDIDILLNAFNRSGFTDGYFTGHTGAHMMSFNSPSNISEERFEADIKKTFAENANFRRVDVSAYCEIKRGRKASLTLADCDGNEVCAFGEIPQMSDGRQLEYERVYAQLSKFGSVPFALKKLKLDLDEGLAMPISEINALRRNACSMLEEKRANPARNPLECTAAGAFFFSSDDKAELSVEVRTLEQARAALEFEPDRLYVSCEIADKLKDFTGKTEIVTKLGAIVNNENEKNYKNIPTKAVMCQNFGGAYAAGEKHILYGGYRLNVYNTKCAAFYLNNGFKRVTLSPELSIKDIDAMDKRTVNTCEVLAYGYIPLMTIKNCLIKSCGGKCGAQKGIYYLTDRMKERFLVLCEKESCTNLLLNSKPLYMADKLDELMRVGVKKYVLTFTVEDGETCRRICSEYVRAMHGEKVINSMGVNNFTRAHFYRGVK